MGSSYFFCQYPLSLNHSSSFHLINWQVALENGLILCYDARTLPSDSNSLARPRFTLAAHDGAASALDINPHIRGCMVTGGTDKLVKIWNIADGDNTKLEVSLVTSRDLGVVCGHITNPTYCKLMIFIGTSLFRHLVPR